MDGSLVTVLCYSFMWSTLYFTLCLLNSKRSYEWHCRSVTAIHALTVSLLTAWCGFVQGPWPFTECDPARPNTPLQMTSIEICLGYFLFDLTWCVYFKSEGVVMLLHHICSIMGMTVAVVTGHYGTEMIASIFGSELSNPLLQCRWFLKETGHYNTLLGEVVDIAFMATFGILRIGIGSYLLYSYYMQPTDFLGRFSGTALYALSWVFWISIVSYGINKIKKKLKKMREAKEKKISTQANGEVLNGIEKKTVIAEQNTNGNHVSKMNGNLSDDSGLRVRQAFKESAVLNGHLNPIVN